MIFLNKEIGTSTTHDDSAFLLPIYSILFVKFSEYLCFFIHHRLKHYNYKE